MRGNEEEGCNLNRVVQEGFSEEVTLNNDLRR